KGNDIVHTHFYKLLKSQRTVQRLTAAALVLAALVEERHDDIDTARLPSDRGDDTLQILKVVVRGHVVDLTVQGIGQAVVADIHHQIDILSTDGFAEYAFCFS